MKPLLHEAARMVGSLMVVAAFLWAAGEPHMRDFVVKTVEAKDYASNRQVMEANKKLDQTGISIRELENGSARVEQTQKLILEELREQRQINREILRSLRQRN